MKSSTSELGLNLKEIKESLAGTKHGAGAPQSG